LKIYLADPVREEIQAIELEERQDLLKALRAELPGLAQDISRYGQGLYRTCDVLGYRCTFRKCHIDECEKLGVVEACMVVAIQKLIGLAADGLASA
jgi:hypothetical protein